MVTTSAGGEGTGRTLLALLALLAFCVVGLRDTLTNASLPAGDGLRVFPYLEFVESASSAFPLWNPYRVGGMPTLSDPERFVWLSKLVGSRSEHRFLFFNGLLAAGVVALSWAVFGLGRELGLSRFGAWVSAALVAGSQFTSSFVAAGRLEPLGYHALVTAGVWVTLRRSREPDPLAFALVCAIFAVLLAGCGYYAPLLFFVPVLCFGLGRGRAPATLLRELAMISLVAALLAAVFLLPLVESLAGLSTRVAPRSTLADAQPAPGSLLNLFLPVAIGSEKKLFFHVSLALLPGLVLYLLARGRSAWVAERGVVALGLVGLLFSLGGVAPVSWLIGAMGELPLLRNVRWTLPFAYFVTTSLALLAGAGFERAGLLGDRSRRSLVAPAAAAATLLLASLVLEGLGRATGAPAEDGFLPLEDPLRAAGLLLLLSLPYPFLGRRGTPLYLGLLLALQLLWLRPFLGHERLEGQDAPPPVRSALLGDPDYFATFLGAWSRNWTGLPGVRNLYGFSIYFSEEHRAVLRELFSSSFPALRPHWVPTPPLWLWNPRIADMLNLKYVIRKKPAQELPVWEPVLVVGRYTLFRRRDWRSSLVVFDTWSSVQDMQIALRRVAEEGFRGRLWVEGPVPLAPGSGAGPHEWRVEIERYAAEEMELRVATNRNGILFVPEYYDPGWTAEVDGESSPVLRANGCCRGVAVAAGEHRVRLRYTPRLFRVGATISALAAGALALATGHSWLRRRRARHALPR